MTGALKVWSPLFGGSGNGEAFHCRNELSCDEMPSIPAMIPATVAGIGPFLGPFWPDSGGCNAVPLKARLADRTIGHNYNYRISRLFLFGHSLRMADRPRNLADRPHCRDDQTEDGRARIESKLSIRQVERTAKVDSVIQDSRITDAQTKRLGEGYAEDKLRKGNRR